MNYKVNPWKMGLRWTKINVPGVDLIKRPSSGNGFKSYSKYKTVSSASM
jgi:hypothetical protein